ncbi:MAG: hypothetical protein NXY57DRAFT_1044920 [Lentinula lateritia]|nr:MAG: hypothetical protein NXY57DRAFT_1044920 [Lentinula lateritia]
MSSSRFRIGRGNMRVVLDNDLEIREIDQVLGVSESPSARQANSIVNTRMIANLDSELSILDTTFCSPPLAEESLNADPATSLVGSAVKDHSTDPVVHFMSSGEAVSDFSLISLLKWKNGLFWSRRIKSINAQKFLETRPLTIVMLPLMKRFQQLYPKHYSQIPAATHTADPQEFSANTLGLKKPSLGHEIQLPELTAPLDTAQIDVEKSVKAMPDSPNVGIATRDSSDLRVHVNEVEGPESRWTPSYSVSNQGPDVNREGHISAIEQLP